MNIFEKSLHKELKLFEEFAYPDQLIYTSILAIDDRSFLGMSCQ